MHIYRLINFFNLLMHYKNVLKSSVTGITAKKFIEEREIPFIGHFLKCVFVFYSFSWMNRNELQDGWDCLARGFHGCPLGPQFTSGSKWQTREITQVDRQTWVALNLKGCMEIDEEDRWTTQQAYTELYNNYFIKWSSGNHFFKRRLVSRLLWCPWWQIDESSVWYNVRKSLSPLCNYASKLFINKPLGVCSSTKTSLIACMHVIVRMRCFLHVVS